MRPVNLSVNRDCIDKLKEETGMTDASQIARDALALLQFAVSEARDGRALFTADHNGENIKRIVLPSLEKPMKNAPPPSSTTSTVPGYADPIIAVPPDTKSQRKGGESKQQFE